MLEDSLTPNPTPEQPEQAPSPEPKVKKVKRKHTPSVYQPISNISRLKSIGPGGRTAKEFIIRSGLEAQAVAKIMESRDPEIFFEWLGTMPKIHKDCIPKSLNGMIKSFRGICEYLKMDTRVTAEESMTSMLIDGIDQVLSLNSGAAGAMYKNLIQVCLKKMVEMEAADRKRNTSFNQANMLKYLEQIRMLTDKVRDEATDLSKIKQQLADTATKDAESLLSTVRDVVYDLFPARAEDFQKALMARLGQQKNSQLQLAANSVAKEPKPETKDKNEADTPRQPTI